jgi:predicted nucleotidyltransferase
MEKAAAGTEEKVEKIIREMVRRVVEGFHPEMIVLFGSHARGDAGPDSDVDLLVVMPVNGSKRDLTIRIRKALAGIGMAKDVVVATPEELARYRDLVGTIIYPAIHEGKVLYERSA